jgi:hypothetical protein
MQAKVIPVIKGATGTISKLLRQYLSNILWKLKLSNYKQTAILRTAYVLREGLM